MLAVSLVDGHDDVVQNSETELFAQQALHQREIEADAHPVLMTFAVVRAGREHALVVKRDLEIELAL